MAELLRVESAADFVPVQYQDLFVSVPLTCDSAIVAHSIVQQHHLGFSSGSLRVYVVDPITSEKRLLLPRTALVTQGVTADSRLCIERVGGVAGIGRLARVAPAPSHSVTEVVGPTFENEACNVLTGVFREICPWYKTHSNLLSRKLDRDDNAREADVMCYVQDDNLGPCMPLRSQGVAVVGLPDGWVPAPPLPPVALEVTRQFSPTDVARLGPHKYFLAEVYSGANQETMKEKVTQLETLCEFLVGRWSDQHDDLPPVTDVTSVVGAAALVFSAGDASRFQMLNTAIDLVDARVSRGVGSECKNLKRLLCAGRLLIIVLDKSQSPKHILPTHRGQRACGCTPRHRTAASDPRGARRCALRHQGLARSSQHVKRLRSNAWWLTGIG